LAAEIREAFPDARVELIPSGGGRFEIMSDGQPVFEKSKLGRHASPGDVVRLLRSTPR
jgi:selT/selW/selH-like putative selenoprotein